LADENYRNNFEDGAQQVNGDFPMHFIENKDIDIVFR
jgi:hypothetical protein